MTRYLVVSDTHGKTVDMGRRLDYLDALGADALIHLGDFVADGQWLADALRLPLHAVAGNCDGFRCKAPNFDILEDQGVRILLCHGHTYSVKHGTLNLFYAAQEMNCTVALFGHTHESYLEREGGILLLNPGSLGAPRLSDPTVALLDLDKGTAKGLILPCKT